MIEKELKTKKVLLVPYINAEAYMILDTTPLTDFVELPEPLFRGPNVLH